MSVIVVAVGNDGIVVASDGVCYRHETGIVSGFVSKVILLPEYNCFIGSTGAGAFGAALRLEIEQKINSFDDLTAGFADFCISVHRKLFTNILGYWDRSRSTHISCIIGGWSNARQAYEAYRLVSYDKQSTNFKTGETITLESFVAVPLPNAIWCSLTPEAMEEFDLAPPLPNEDTIDVVSRLVCAARAESGITEGEEDGSEEFYMAGGFLQIAAIQQGCSQSWIAHRWPADQIGMMIDPTGPERYPKWLKERHERFKAALEEKAA